MSGVGGWGYAVLDGISIAPFTVGDWVILPFPNLKLSQCRSVTRMRPADRATCALECATVWRPINRSIGNNNT